jgi:hypothetical protein
MYEIKRMYNKTVMAYFKVLSHYLQGESKENNKKPGSSWITVRSVTASIVLMTVPVGKLFGL